MPEYTGGKCELKHSTHEAVSEKAVGGKTGGSAKATNLEGKTIGRNYDTSNPTDSKKGSTSVKSSNVTGAKI